MTERSYDDYAELEENLKRVEEEICAACAAAGRRREEVRLLAVTKTVPIERINRAIEFGVRQIGENRVQEYLQKSDALLCPVETHLIGHLQTNKVNAIVGKVDMIESVDSLRLAEMISRRSQTLGIITQVLVEVNIGGEESKSGVAPDKLDELLEKISPLPGIKVRGLMTIAPILTEERKKRAVFSKMLRLFVDKQGKKMDNIDMRELSMGMSGDFREAIAEGSTIVRIGSAIFGKRDYSI